MADTTQREEPTQLYDIDAGLRELDVALVAPDDLTIETASLGRRLAYHLSRHFTPEERETIGRALVVTGASVGALAGPGIPPMVLVNVIAFAGRALTRDSVIQTPADGAP
jgi:hypothetical protein